MLKRKVMIIDDSVVARRAISEAIKSTDDIEVAALAANGRIALAKLPRVQPDVVLLDVEMPEMDGLETLSAIRAEYPSLPVIMFSALTGRGAKITLDALSLGANDYATKPTANGGSMQQQLGVDLFPKIRALCKAKGAPPTIDIVPTPVVWPRIRRSAETPSVVVVGASTGGPNALARVVADLKSPFPVPVLVVQHMPPIFTRLLAERLHHLSDLDVREAVDGEPLRAGRVYVAPGDFHLMVERRDRGVVTRLTQAPPENSCRPAADVLFRSAAAVFGHRTLAVVLTGMGRDGLEGCRQLYETGAQIVCQDEETSIVWGMPGYVARANLAHDVIGLEQLSDRINDRVLRPAHFREGKEVPPC